MSLEHLVGPECKDGPKKKKKKKVGKMEGGGSLYRKMETNWSSFPMAKSGAVQATK